MASGPGKSRREREGLTLIQLIDMFPDEESARDWFESARWPEARPGPSGRETD